MASEPSESLLKSRSYIGLLLSQFLAAFNDQAIHFVAVFYAGDMLVRYLKSSYIDEKGIVTIVPLCFIAPFFFFSPVAGILADKFSKRTTIVFWKYAEIGITGLALVGFLLPHAAHLGWASPQALAAIGASLVIAAVFMMGTHSAVFHSRQIRHHARDSEHLGAVARQRFAGRNELYGEHPGDRVWRVLLRPLEGRGTEWRSRPWR